MSNEQEKINRWFKKYGWNHQTFFNRPHCDAAPLLWN